MAIFLVLLAIAIIAVAIFRWSRRSKPALPVRIDRECIGRLDSGLPVEFWLVISNDADINQTISVTIEYTSGRAMMEHLSIAPGQVRHKIPEPHRVQRISIIAAGYKGLLIYV